MIDAGADVQHVSDDGSTALNVVRDDAIIAMIKAKISERASLETESAAAASTSRQKRKLVNLDV